MGGSARLTDVQGQRNDAEESLGRTGLQISEIAFGGGVTGGILINADETDAVRALHRAVAVGINWIDTAPLYGNGASEETIGRHIESLEPRPYVSTKVAHRADEMKDIAGAIERSLEASLKRLRPRSVALFQLHNHIGAAVGDRQIAERRSRCSAAAASPTPSTGSRSRG